MHAIRTCLLAGAAAGLLCIAGGMALAGSPRTHVLTVRLPGGAIEEIRYNGNVRPQVFVSPEGMPADIARNSAFFGPGSAFAELDRISEAMDRQMQAQMQAMLRDARTFAQEPRLLTRIDVGKLPAGAQSFSFVSTVSGSGVCGKSVEITARGEGEKPQVVSKSWGDCGTTRGAPGVKLAPAAARPSNVREIDDRSRTPAPLIREARAL
jgi:hypothetical protein